MDYVRHYIYESDQHCTYHASERFGDALDDPDTVDQEGNPIGVCFVWNDCEDPDYCSDCVYEELYERLKSEGRAI
jgi:hypothetical protein